MAARQTLNMRQAPALVMTQQMHLAFKLLTFSNAELVEYVERELESNPLLERDEREFAPVAAEGDAGLYGTTASLPVDQIEPKVEPSRPDEEVHTLCPVDQADDVVRTYDEAWQGIEDAADVQAGAAVAFEEWGAKGASGAADDFLVTETLADQESLRSIVDRQINVDLASPHDRQIAFFLADHLDAAGYLSASVDDVAQRLGETVGRVEAVLAVIQRFEPAGIFARDLKECLRLQLIEKRWFDDVMARVMDHLALVADANLDRLAKACDISIDQAIHAVKKIRSLNPKPAQGFEVDVIEPVTPDVILSNRSDGGWIIRLNADNLPRVLVNQTYRAQVSADGLPGCDQQYLKAHYDRAHWLMNALHQRAQTMIKVATAIVECQYGFFKSGIMKMQPLGLKDIAAAIDMHESTISRATANKYIQTPQGTFELNYFFSAAVRSDHDGPAVSSEVVRHRIKALVQAEQPNDILSDDALVEKLSAEGVIVARRTVTKYRESLNIASSSKRRRLKEMQVTNPCAHQAFTSVCQA